MIESTELYAIECAALAAGVSALLLLYLYRWLTRIRPDFACGAPCALALGVRVVAVLAVSALGETGQDLRGPDDPAFLDEANRLADGPIALSWLTESRGDLLSAVVATQVKVLGDPGAASLRLLQAGIAVAGIMLVAFAVHELGGRRAAQVAAWLLAVEPANVFFSSIVHKEAILLLAGGLTLVGVAALWRERIPTGLLLSGLGVLLAAGVRPYAAGFLLAGVVLVAGHLLLRHLRGRGRILVAVVATFLAIAVAGVAFSSSWGEAQLSRLQNFQDSQATVGNLRLEPVDFTTAPGFARGVAIRTRDLLVRPYPWEQANLSQRLAILGTLPAWLLTLAVVIGVIRRRFTADALPVAYVLVATTVGYAVTTANAGTGFRHRMQVVVFLSALAAIVWLHRDQALRRTPRQEPGSELEAH